MEIISTYSNGNYEAQVTKSFDNLYTVTYMINNRVFRKTNHVTQDLAEDLAEDFVLEGGTNPQLLNEAS
jgi:hypothetical protein